MTEIKQIDRDSAELKPCPFCADRMMLQAGDLIVHREQNPNCPIRQNSWPVATWGAAWNTRTTAEAEVEALRGALDKAAARFEHCANMIAESHAISGTLRAERTIKARHFALEARQALNTHAGSE